MIDEEENEEGEIFEIECGDCEGKRLNERALSVTIEDKNIYDLGEMELTQLREFLEGLEVSPSRKVVVEKILEPIIDRLHYLEVVGTTYLNLNRPSWTLSGGETQRIRLASQLGARLVGVLYVLDEPSIGLHPRDHHKLLTIIKEICDRGNTVVIVEHDEDTILSGDHVIDIGPGAGRMGGELLFDGTIQGLKKSSTSVTAPFLLGKEQVFRARPEKSFENWVSIEGATGNNLKSLSVKIPVEAFTVVTGVSGSGKSTLVMETLVPYALAHFNRREINTDNVKTISGLESLKRLVKVNQKPIGRTPRSIPATYIGVFSELRTLFASLPEAQIRGFTPSDFSFNVTGGRCEDCSGQGQVRMEMPFMPDTFVHCESCNGKRYQSELLAVQFKGHNISDVLEMSINEAADLFKHHRKLFTKLEIMQQVGMGYMKLGQSSTTLSGGEAQRVKLGKELCKQGQSNTLFVLDEPTTGLHFKDIVRLIDLIHRLVDKGHSVVVIEHNTDVIASADYVIDLGPEGGRDGGTLMGTGSPQKIAKTKNSHTGFYLNQKLSY